VSIQVNAPPVVVGEYQFGGRHPRYLQRRSKRRASYTTPIAVSPGTAGMEPRVALSYSKQIQSDLLGVGWSVGGLR